MSLSPAVITVKRKREDEPLELLYVEREGSLAPSDPKRRRRVQSAYRLEKQHEQEVVEDSLHKSSRKAAASPVCTQKIAPQKNGIEPSHPAVTEQSYTLPDADSYLCSMKSSFHFPNTPSASIRSASPRPRKELRKFVLTKERFSEYSRSHTPQHGVQKKKGPSRQGMAVFSEQKLSKLRSMASIDHLGGVHPARSHQSLRATTSQSFKRPSATPQERQWREQNWQLKGDRIERSISPLPGRLGALKHTQGSHPDQDTASLELAASLQQFTLTTMAHEDPVMATSTQQSKPVPPPTESLRAADQDSKAKPGDVEAEHSDWVYDRYVKDTDMDIDGDSTALSRLVDGVDSFAGNTNPPSSDGATYGLLVIREEDKEDWEAFATEDAAGDDDGYSEDEDSNAEDFYANDYPEAELSSDDEFVEPGAAYRAKTRVNDSAEEHDLTNDTWSDDNSYGFSSAEEDEDEGEGAQDDWKALKGHRVGPPVEQLAYGGDDSD